MVIVVLCLTALGAALVDDDAKGRDGVVVLSDGQKRTGRVFATTGKKIDVYDFVTKKRRSFAFDDVIKIVNHVEARRMDRDWTFETEGKDDKIKHGPEYPIVDHVLEVWLKNGERLKGHVVAFPVYVLTDPDDDPERFIIYRRKKGAPGQKYDDLVYVASIVFDTGGADEVKPPDGAICGKFMAGPVHAAYAFGHTSLVLFEGRVATDGSYRIEKLPADVYDLLFLGKNRVFFGLSGRDGSRDRIAGERRKKIVAAVGLAEEFFEGRDIFRIADAPKSVFVLLRNRRIGDTSYEKGAAFWRVDIWKLDAAGDEFVIEKRISVARGVFDDGGELPTITRIGQLEGLTVAGGQTLAVDVHAGGSE